MKPPVGVFQALPILIALVGLLYYVAKTIDESDQSAKKRLSHFLKNPRFERLNSVCNIFISFFNVIYSKKHFSKKCFFMSSFTSVISFLLIFFYVYPDNISLTKDIYDAYSIWNTPDNISRTYEEYYDINKDDDRRLFKSKSSFEAFADGLPFLVILSLICFFLFFNIIPDFFSLFETRIVLRLIKEDTSAGRVLTFLVFDFLLTGAIYFVSVLIAMIFYWSITINISGFGFLILPGTFFVGGVIIVGWICLLTTFTTSVWLWVFCILVFLPKLFRKVSTPFSSLDNFFDLDSKPFQTVWAIQTFLFILFFTAWFLSEVFV